MVGDTTTARPAMQNKSSTLDTTSGLRNQLSGSESYTILITYERKSHLILSIYIVANTPCAISIEGDTHHAYMIRNNII